MTSEIKRYESGVYTSEGNVAGDAAAKYNKQREEQSESYEKRKRDIETDKRRTGVLKIDEAFTAESKTLAESALVERTVGLVTISDFRKAREAIASEAEALKKARKEKDDKRAKKKKKKRGNRLATTLSFDADELLVEDDDGVGGGGGGGDDGGSSPKSRPVDPLEPHAKRKRIGKDPTVETGFLPDADREIKEAEMRDKLKKEWLEEQENIKREKIEVTYSYWDGSGHRRNILVPKGATIGKFLEWVRQDLTPEFPEMRGVSSGNLLYIKEDLIIPQHFSFYDLIVTKARGKSGPLFHFDVHDDVRLRSDATIEKDESHPGKVCERRWYERNKHIFPASRWEIYDPKVKYDRYTIHGKG